MKEKLTREEVLHVARLARIELTEKEIDKFQRELKIMIDEIDKIRDLDDFDEERLIAPVEHKARLREDQVEETLAIEEVMKNVSRRSGNFIEVPVMIND